MFEDFNITKYETPRERERAANLPVAERQLLIKQMLVQTPTFNKTVAFLQRQHMPVPGGLHGTGRVCGILGPSRVGKTWGVKAYCNSLGFVDSDNAIMPRAVYVDCKKKWTPLVFAQTLADEVNAHRRGRASAAAILELVTDDLVEHKVELLVIDDTQWMFTNGDAADLVKGFLIGLAERRTCNIVLVGTEPISLIVRSEQHLFGRGQFPTCWLEGSNWREGRKPGEFHLALGEIDDMLPFAKPSNLMSPTLAAHLYHVSAGKLGLAMNYIVDAADAAMREGASHVTLEHFHEIAQDRRLRDDVWDPFKSPINFNSPGIARSLWDKEDEEAAQLIEENLKRQSETTLHKRGGRARSVGRAS